MNEPRGVVYRLIGVDGSVLYVGSTHDIHARVASHQYIPAQGSRVAEVRHSRRMPLTAARLTEALLIQEHRPPFNLIRNPRYVGLTKAEKRQRVAEAISCLPVVTGRPVVIDDEPEALVAEIAARLDDLNDVVLGGAA